MTTVYLHIGIPKTGTTVIQHLLFRNRQTLLAKGYLYPLAGLPNKVIIPAILYSHTRLFAAIKNKNNYCIWEEFNKEINRTKPENVVISAESFGTPISYESIMLLSRFLSKYKTKVIIYLRRQDDYFVSYYCQDIKMAWSGKNFREWMIEYKSYGDYYKLLTPWKELFGKENIIVRVYEREQLNNGLVYDFFKSIELEKHFEQLDVNEKFTENVTPSVKAVKIMQIVNNFFLGKFNFKAYRLTKFYHEKVLKDKSVFLRLVSTIPETLITNELVSFQERINLLKEFEESNRKVAQEYLGRPDGQLFYSNPF